jgi:hypothetical protein
MGWEKIAGIRSNIQGVGASRIGNAPLDAGNKRVRQIDNYALS